MMDREKDQKIPIPREAGILQKSGKGFHSSNDFVRDNLIYAAWSNRYLCDSHYAVTRDFLDFFSLIYVISGKMEFVYEGETILVSENEAMLLDFRKPHHYHSLSDRLDKFEVIFGGGDAEAYYKLITGNWGYRQSIHGRTKVFLEQMMDELLLPLPDDYTLSLLFHSLFTYIIKAHQLKLSAPIRKALDYINECSSEPLQINEVADYVGLSRSYFSRLFVKETGQTPYDYMMEVRINKAKQMLALDMLSVSDVAEQCGFVNVSHFIRVFREKTGQTPASFRSFFKVSLSGP
jgi:AraC-like DNA-binding protein